MRTPFVIIVVLLAVLLAVGFATDGGSSGSGAPAPAPSTPVATIARRVERLRGLRYDAIPKPVRVTAAEARRDGLADLDRSYQPAARRADEALYALLGLLPAGTDLRKVSASVFGDQVAGYYDPTSKRLRIVEGTATANRVLDEIVLAHELTHVLEDQRIGLDLGAAGASDDRGYAYKALLEGTATELMYGYLARFFRSDVALGGLLGASFASGAGTGELPPFVVAGLLFPYQAGQRFVDVLYRRAGRSWALVNLAERRRPPVSTEQIMHPQKWLAAEAPVAVRVPAPPGGGWRRLTAGTFGEFQTARLLALAGRAQPGAAAGWGGDRYALYRRGGGTCVTPCPRRDALVVSWRWDSARDAEQFAPALRATLADGLGARGAGRGGYRVRGAAARVVAGRDRTALVMAPTTALADRLARATLRR